ncbi:hypothetical protein WOLCODRAFT_139976 [Wolfiporia cocos MD-104 SS10]|uniref:Uncharacterized protein n=1 Tax=Wolfiporia cocos (strain MD-104) TaxID=742152 RepID=A0A2H3J0W4_WOLCO|nr:hypothetical protein WOLCODRAFT_139976 [Wolfiporia cocos MD-104 SS10]
MHVRRRRHDTHHARVDTLRWDEWTGATASVRAVHAACDVSGSDKARCSARPSRRASFRNEMSRCPVACALSWLQRRPCAWQSEWNVHATSVLASRHRPAHPLDGARWPNVAWAIAEQPPPPPAANDAKCVWVCVADGPELTTRRYGTQAVHVAASVETALSADLARSKSNPLSPIRLRL